jgi:hypothetical protein
MYRLYYAERDTTLYEQYPDQNTGIDQILELTKIASGSKLNGLIQSNQYNSRILIDFGTEITSISQSISDGTIPALSSHPDSASAHITLKAADASDLLHSYEIKAYPISESWENGNGNYSDDPVTKNGSSWFYRTRDQEDAWDIANATANGHGAAGGVTEANGGGTWITGSTYEASQSFDNQSPDVRINVTDIVNNWVGNNISNNGFIIKHVNENETNSKILGSIKFFGRESHTIFVPKLEIMWNDTTFANTSSAEISAETYIPYFKNIKAEYRTSEITKFRIGVRPEFPSKTFQTSSFYLTGERLPTSSFYSILDSVTNETLIPFDTNATKIDCDANGSFMKIRMDSFMPERHYKIMLKVERDGGNDVQTFDEYYFKVVN